jgi:hypothetical protein
MGTNYYLHPRPDCECCGRPFEPLHIGKSSVGWCFGLHVIPEDGINTLEDWRERWKAPGAVVRDEYGREVTIGFLEEVITKREFKKDWESDWWKLSYVSEEQFHSSNYSVRGPKGLLRSAVNGWHCVGHGRGTWDYIRGEFS